MKKYTIPVTFKFKGNFNIEANSLSEAIEMVTSNCSLSMGVVKSTLPQTKIGWDFDMIPIKSINVTNKELYS